MHVKEFFERISESTVYMFIVFIMINIVFVFFLSIIVWIGMNDGEMKCNGKEWKFPLIPCCGEVSYNTSSPFIEVFVVFTGIYFGMIFVIFITRILINYYEER